MAETSERTVTADIDAWLASNWDPERSLLEWRRLLVAAGWAAPSWPPQHGGRGLPAWADDVVAEALARAGAVGLPVGPGMLLAAPTLLAHASSAMQDRLLPRLLTGEHTWCQLFSEPGAGSDLAGLTTTATRDGDRWLVNGQKVWTTSAHHADMAMLLARTDWSVPKHAGITYFALPMHQDGIDVRPLRQMNGEAHFNEVFLSGVRIPAANVIGDVDDGWKVAVTTLSNERVAISGGSGVSDPERLLRLARENGRANDPLFRQEFARAWSRNEIIRYLRLRTRTAMSQGRRAGPEGSVMKLAYARYVKHLSKLAIDTAGPAGMLAYPDAVADGVFLQKFINAVQSSIGGGTDEIQRNIVSERVLGLPREPR
jgi:alkylation response protein AidB-like acyl-CoA dehydrogenase